MLDVTPSLKHSPSSTPPPHPPSSPTKKSKSNTGTPQTPKSRSSHKKTSSTSPSPGINGSWSAEKKGQFMDEIIAAGYKSADLDGIASKIGMSKRQLVDQLVPNRGNMRGKAVKAVSTDT